MSIGNIVTDNENTILRLRYHVRKLFYTVIKIDRFLAKDIHHGQAICSIDYWLDGLPKPPRHDELAHARVPVVDNCSRIDMLRSHLIHATAMGYN